MRADRWELIKTTFHAALERAPAERDAFLAAACGADADLREEVDSLLDADAVDDAFMEAPAFAAAADAASHGPLGTRVGPYRLVGEIGRGGMGAVYRAERDDGHFRQVVAVKLVKRGMDTDLILERFRHERQILAELDHPNIARLLDGGTSDDGRPYFVMELIEGEPIDRYCTARSLGIADRLALFRDVCAAVQYAHQRLVVHRDIKPANVLVTAGGVPKLLDFGIAKLLTTDGGGTRAPTAAALRAMTPEYASPEQVRGEPVTTLSDVYSLGVVLYELLTGRHPYTPTARTPADLVHAVTQTEPARPSTIVTDERVRRGLRGDLDTIVLAAMRKDPSRRYASVEQLSEDVRRHLAGLPVRARPDTVAYRATTFVRRNRLGVAAAALVLASLLGGIVGTTREARIARAERARAERRFDDVRTLATSFLFELHDAIVNLPGSTPARALLVRRALTSLDGLARDAQGDQRLQRELAAAYERVGRVQGNSYNSNLGDTEGAVASYRKSVAIRERVARADPQNDSVQAELADGYEGLGNLRSGEGEMSAALGDYERALALRRRVLARHPDALGYRSALAELENSIGDIKGQEGYGGLGDMTGALASYRESVALREDVFRATPSDREALVGLTNSLMNLGYLKAALGDPTGSGDLARSAALLERAVAAHPDDALWRLHLLSAYARLRQPAVDEGRFAEAIAVDRKSIVMLEALAAADRANTLVRRNLGVTYNYLGRDLRAAGRARDALPLHRRALAMAEGLAARDAKNGEHRHDVAITHFWLAEALAETRDLEGAVAEYRRAALAKEALRVAEPSSTRHGDDLARILAGMARAQLAMGALDAAADALREAVPAAEAAAARTATNQRAQSILAATYLTVGRLHVRRAERSPAAAGEWTEARRWLERSTSLWNAQRRRGTLSALDTASLHLATRELARCTAALGPGGGVP